MLFELQYDKVYMCYQHILRSVCPSVDQSLYCLLGNIGFLVVQRAASKCSLLSACLKVNFLILKRVFFFSILSGCSNNKEFNLLSLHDLTPNIMSEMKLRSC